MHASANRHMRPQNGRFRLTGVRAAQFVRRCAVLVKQGANRTVCPPCGRVAVVLALLTTAGGAPVPLSAEGIGSDLAGIARQMAQVLQWRGDEELSMTVVPQDCAYMLPVDPLFRILRDHVANQVRTVHFNLFRGNGEALVRSLVRAGAPEYAPLALEPRRLDSLILAMTCHLPVHDSSSLYYSIRCINVRGDLLYESDEFLLRSGDAPMVMRRTIFDTLRQGAGNRALRYRGRVVQALDNFFLQGAGGYLLHPATYRFVNNNAYALDWQRAILLDVLRVKYGVELRDEGVGTMTLAPRGDLTVSRGGKIGTIPALVDGEGLLPDSFWLGGDSLRYLYASRGGDGGVRSESKEFETGYERQVRATVERVFSREYPRLFDPFDRERLCSLFVDLESPAVLVGRRLITEAGGEQAIYRWMTPRQWIDALAAAGRERGRRFAVRTSIAGVFADNVDSRRYWVVATQHWTTLNEAGTAVYEDDGFMIVNLDFDAQAVLRRLRIHYRLWFNRYRLDDVESGRSRVQMLRDDIERWFVKGVGGVDPQLKQAMMQRMVALAGLQHAGPLQP